MLNDRIRVFLEKTPKFMHRNVGKGPGQPGTEFLPSIKEKMGADAEGNGLTRNGSTLILRGSTYRLEKNPSSASLQEKAAAADEAAKRERRQERKKARAETMRQRRIQQRRTHNATPFVRTSEGRQGAGRRIFTPDQPSEIFQEDKKSAERKGRDESEHRNAHGHPSPHRTAKNKLPSIMK